MQRCLHLAVQGLGSVAPNPMVGCVIVHNGKIIGEGFHEKYGSAHAEVNAIRSVTDEKLLAQSTLYVNLEPCSHYGKTPPCANLIVEKKIPRVVIGSYDPNPLVAGKGIKLLRENGVEVMTEVLKPEADFLNRRFFTFHTQQRPYIILKWAQSADGFIAPADGKPYWLTNEVSKKLVHQWRSEEQAIMIGTNTARTDNPQLTVRLWHGNNPLRVVIDRTLSLPASLHIFNAEAATLVFNEKGNAVKGNIEKVKIDFSANIEEQILHELFKRNILSIMIEGGTQFLNSFINRLLWDEARVFTVTKKLNEGVKAPQVSGTILNEMDVERDKLIVCVSL